MKQHIKNLQAVISTLQDLEIRSTEDNMDKLLGCIIELKSLKEWLGEQNTEQQPVANAQNENSNREGVRTYGRSGEGTETDLC